MVPKVEFEVSRVVNEFSHLSVLYSDLMPIALANGILGNRSYQEKHSQLRHDEVRLTLQKTGSFELESEWYNFIYGLMKRDQTGGFQSLSTNTLFVEMFQDMRLQREKGFDEIWKETRPRLVEYMYKFIPQWSPISDKVMLRLQQLTRTHWQTDKILVQYVDCLYGGFAWKDCIGLTAFPDMDVQKKLLAHELSELITPHRTVVEGLQKAGLDPGIAHTVVDMLAYLSIRDFLSKPDHSGREKKGIRPNPSYYPATEVLFPILERYADNPSVFPDFAALVEDLISRLRPLSQIH